MKITTYQLISNIEVGFSINEEEDRKYNKDGSSVKTGRINYALWVDSYEGGDAFETDWDYIDFFTSEQDAIDYIKTNYGDIKKIKVWEQTF